MSTDSQFAANRQNAQASTGPRTPQGKSVSARNAAKFGLYSTRDVIQPDEAEEYATLTAALLHDLAPHGALEEVLAAEIMRAAWRLHRCSRVEAELTQNGAADPMSHNNPAAATLAAIDRARAQSHRILHRSLAELRRLQTERAAHLSIHNRRSAENQYHAKRSQSDHASTARNAPCPCGSGQKHKRCCGQNAPRLTQTHLKQAA